MAYSTQIIIIIIIIIIIMFKIVVHWTEERREKQGREIWRERKKEGRKQLKQTWSTVACSLGNPVNKFELSP